MALVASATICEHVQELAKGEYHGTLLGNNYKVEIDLKKGSLEIGKE